MRRIRLKRALVAGIVGDIPTMPEFEEVEDGPVEIAWSDWQTTSRVNDPHPTYYARNRRVGPFASELVSLHPVVGCTITEERWLVRTWWEDGRKRSEALTSQKRSTRI